MCSLTCACDSFLSEVFATYDLALFSLHFHQGVMLRGAVRVASACYSPYGPYNGPSCLQQLTPRAISRPFVFPFAHVAVHRRLSHYERHVVRSAHTPYFFDAPVVDVVKGRGGARRAP